ncbi:MAG: hypothetical protein A2010_06925 [Nitrospirae bacterium GWD2_57_9]|nr:MAG: hypothetical protein A2010_06925 [Nitrospirae bacterium GWD2_57_9]
MGWQQVVGATSYDLYFSTTTGVTKTTGTKISGASSLYTHKALTNGVKHYYIVSAVKTGGTTVESSEFSATPSATGTAPDNPASIQAVPGNQNNFVIWPSVLGAVSYNLYWTDDGGITVNPVPNAASPYLHDRLANGTVYEYSVTAVNSYGESDPNTAPLTSGTPSATGTAPAAPAGVTAAPGSGQGLLKWDAVSNASSYSISQSTASGVTPATGSRTDMFGFPQVTLKGLTNGTTYYFVVTARNSYGESTASAQVSATPVQAFYTPPPNPTAVCLCAGMQGCAGAGPHTQNSGMRECWSANVNPNNPTYCQFVRAYQCWNEKGYENPCMDMTLSNYECELDKGNNPCPGVVVSPPVCGNATDPGPATGNYAGTFSFLGGCQATPVPGGTWFPNWGEEGMTIDANGIITFPPTTDARVTRTGSVAGNGYLTMQRDRTDSTGTYLQERYELSGMITGITAAAVSGTFTGTWCPNSTAACGGQSVTCIGQFDGGYLLP